MRRLNQSPLSPSDICVLAAHIVASLSQVYLTITSVHFPANQKVLGGTSISLSLSLSLSLHMCVCVCVCVVAGCRAEREGLYL